MCPGNTFFCMAVDKGSHIGAMLVGGRARDVCYFPVDFRKNYRELSLHVFCFQGTHAGGGASLHGDLGQGGEERPFFPGNLLGGP